VADQKRINAVIDAHPLNGRYGFDRNDVIHQLHHQAAMLEHLAVKSAQRGSAKVMVDNETARFMAALALAALQGASDSSSTGSQS